MLIRNVSRNQILGSRIRRANSFGFRLLGLMFRSGLASGEGLFITPCKAVHTHFMRFSIDLIFIDKEWQVLHVAASMRPWGFSPHVGLAWAVLELPAGAAGETAAGDRLAMEAE